LTNTGADSGLDKSASDYVGRVAYQPNRILTFSASTRLNEATWNVERLELDSRANFDRWSVSMLYGNYAAQPDLGYLTRREAILTTGSIKVAANWVVSGGVRYNLRDNKFDQYTVGAGYVDDCYTFAVSYTTDYNYTSSTTTTPTTDHKIMLQIGLRTIGATSYSQSVGTSQ
jgi:LPS-assembly protein